MNLPELILVINFPIFLGWFFKQTKIFLENETEIIRKFVVKVTVPFIVFINLYRADMKDVGQLIPLSLAFLLITIFFCCFVYLLRRAASQDPIVSNSFCIAVFMGNYGYLGWGVLYYFYGDSGFTRSLFFTLFFWPVFLLIGILLTSILSSRGSSGKKSRTKIVSALKSNALIPLLSAIAALYLNFSKIKLPTWLLKSIDSFASITVPAILFTIGLSFSLLIKKRHIKPIILGALSRTVAGILFGIAVSLLVSLFFDVDLTTKKVILLESVMPSAAISPFLLDFVDSDKEVVSGIVAFSTLTSLVTLPFWFSIIEKWTWL